MDGSALSKNNVKIGGAGLRPMIFAHGFGCDQNMWRFVEPAFRADFRTVLYDQVGAGHSDLSTYEPAKYASLEGYADDLVEIGRALALHDAVFVGHSVSAMVGVLASLKAPELFESLVLVGPSPRYINDEAYVAASKRRRSRNCSTSSATTIWVGRRPWLRSSWAMLIDRNSEKS